MPLEIGHASPMEIPNSAGALGGLAQAAASFGNGASESYAAGLRFAQALRSAAAQQAQQQRMQDQHAADEAWKITQAGGTPYFEEQAPVNTGVVPGKGLIPRDQSEAAKKALPEDSYLYRDSVGRQWVVPKKSGLDNKNFTDLNTALKGGYQQPDAQGNVNQMPGVPRYQMDAQGGMTDTGRTGINAAPPSDWRSMDVPGAGKVFKPGINEENEDKQRVGLRAKLAEVAAKADDTGWTPPDPIRKHLEQAAGLPDGALKGIKIPHEAVAGTFGKLLTPEKPEKPDKEPTHEHWINIFTDPDSSPEDKKRAKAALDVEDSYKRRGENAAKAEEKQQKVLDALTKQHDALYEKEQQMHGYRLEWGQNISTPDNEEVVDPETKREVTMNAARRQYYKTKIDTAQNEIAGLQQRRQKLIERATRLSGGTPQPAGTSTAQPAAAAPQSPSVNQAPQQQPAKPTAPAQPQQPAQQQAKVTGLNDVRAYAKEKGIDVPTAIRKFKAAGYAIQQ